MAFRFSQIGSLVKSIGMFNRRASTFVARPFHNNTSLVSKYITKVNSLSYNNFKRENRFFATQATQGTPTHSQSSAIDDDDEIEADPEVDALQFSEDYNVPFDYVYTDEETAPDDTTSAEALMRFVIKKGLWSSSSGDEMDLVPPELRVTEPLMDSKIGTFIEKYTTFNENYRKAAEAVDLTLPEKDAIAQFEKASASLTGPKEDVEKMKKNFIESLKNFYAEERQAQASLDREVAKINEGGIFHDIKFEKI